MSDLLTPLLDAIATVRKRITNHETLLEGDETRTRVSLVDPILVALGWNPADPNLVVLEHKIGGKSADYALLVEGGKPAVIVEAKKLGTSLGGMDQLAQVGMYAIGAGVRLAALTDGDRWQLYDLKSLGSGNEVVFNLTISSNEPQASALQLLALWRPNVLSSDWRKPHDPIAVPDPNPGPGPTPKPAPDPLPTPSDGWIALPDFQGQKNVKPLSPIRLPDGSELPVKHWKDLLTGVVRWLVRKGSLPRNLIPIPVAPNSTRYVLNTQACHQNGKMMGEPEQIGQNLWVETWGSQDTIRGHTALILRHCGEDPRKLQLQKKQ